MGTGTATRVRIGSALRFDHPVTGATSWHAGFGTCDPDR
jgi:hypothetical protein